MTTKLGELYGRGWRMFDLLAGAFTIRVLTNGRRGWGIRSYRPAAGRTDAWRLNRFLWVN